MVKKERDDDNDCQLPQRFQREPRPGDNPLKRPYPQHALDLQYQAEFALEVTKEPDDYNFTKRDLRLPIRPHGVLFFHALEINGLVLSTNNFVYGSPFCVYVELECQDMAKCSDPVYSIATNKVRIDHSVHMSIELSEIRLDEKNDFLMHVYAFQDPEAHYLIGSQVVHIYNFVREIHGITTVQLLSDLSYKVGKFTFEFAWSYGAFGYGFSNQLRNPQNPVLESISHSMFPRIALGPDDITDNHVHARIPKKLRLITLHSLLVRTSRENKVSGENEKAALQTKKSKHKRAQADYEAKTVIFRRVKFSRGRPVHVALNLDIHQKFMEDDFNQTYGEFICLRNRKDRLGWLGRLIEGRLRDRVEFDVGELFMPFDDVQEARRALTTKRPLACPPAYLEHNPGPRGPCGPLGPIKSDYEDVKFMHEKLASAPRFSGYLAYVFGYAKPPPKDAKLESFEYVLDKKAHLTEGQKITDGRNCCQRGWNAMGIWLFHIRSWFMSIYHFLFPSFENQFDEKLPEISLTLPSPQHSTTDFHSYCTQAQVYAAETDLAQTKRKATSYLQMTRKPANVKAANEANLEDDTNEEPEDYTIPTRAFIGETDAPGRGGLRGKDERVLGHVEQTDLQSHRRGKGPGHRHHHK